MNIAFFNRYAMWGGGEKWHSTMADLMAEKGHNVYIFCAEGGEIYKRAVNNPKITLIPTVITKHSYWNPITQFKFYRAFKKLNLDAIVFNDIVDVRAVAGVARKAGAKNIVYRNGMPIVKPLKSSYLKAFDHGITKIVTLSEDSKEMMIKNVHVKNLQDKMSVITNAFDFEKLPSKTEESPIEKKEGEVILVSTGRLTEQKGQSYLIMAAHSLKEKGLNFKVWLIGEGELEEELKTLARGLDVEDKVEFLGFKKDVYPYLYHADIFAFPSLWEGLSNSIIEAQAIGLPSVCFNMSSMKELVHDGVNGYLARPKDEIDFANKLAHLIINEEMREQYGKKAQEIIKNDYNRAAIFEKWENLLASR